MESSVDARTALAENSPVNHGETCQTHLAAGGTPSSRHSGSILTMSLTPLELPAAPSS
eukprot:CAMPEP_0198731408 /NCGR_PEP_ID=MMETSP1475-20131203/29585_1 /TAXON_ID= ORGANISM="Unidentified sp., Strain CCMP1999" /NCGR_SAMPLE_ID=MMETSP1475 /ASSEMBLY_ACC=CAM_ASM_001111 /LENGTH=57 /DNA_ID=CAMNT_0044494369 /DNA_START=28 /DNA_END=198 /DNA_ORIENTATION=-